MRHGSLRCNGCCSAASARRAAAPRRLGLAAAEPPVALRLSEQPRLPFDRRFFQPRADGRASSGDCRDAHDTRLRAREAHIRPLRNSLAVNP